ncbi:hypothetical protein DL93DRAFT_2093649 [Clavulina sp. PMI_390]|nr:hypothetical protein DL93DRAFT_2093649 [Clavulina sp. PMI_390]
MSTDSANSLLLDINEYLNSTAGNVDKASPAAGNPNAQWMDPTSFELFAPDPEAFDRELEAETELGQLDLPFSAQDTLQPLPPAAYYGSYRNGPKSAFNGTVSSVSESQHSYNDYDAASFYSGHESGYNHHLGANGSLYSAYAPGVTGLSAAGSLPQHNSASAVGNPPQFPSPLLQQHQHQTQSHYGNDLDLDLSEFNLSGLPSAFHHMGGIQTPQVLQPQQQQQQQLGATSPPGAASLSSPTAPVVSPQATTASTAAAMAALSALGINPSAPGPIDAATLNSVQLFMNQVSVAALAAAAAASTYSPPAASAPPHVLSSQPLNPPPSSSQSPIDYDALITSSTPTDMYFPRRGDPLGASTSSSSNLAQAQAGRSAIKREATSSPSIPTPDFGALDHHQDRRGKRLAASAASPPDYEEDSKPGVHPSKRYQCPNCERAFARAYNLKTHMQTHDPHRVKSFVCRHVGCGRSFSRKHDLGRHYTSIHGGNSGIGLADANAGNLSGEERASIRGHRAGAPGTHSRNGSAYGGSTYSAGGGSTYGGSANGDEDEDSATEGEGSLLAGKHGASSSSAGALLNKERVWCDGCERGWIQGSREACECDDKMRTTRWVVSAVPAGIAGRASS